MEREVLSGLRAEAGGEFLDCTLGGGGHTRAILAANPRNTVYAADRDAEAVRRAERELEGCLSRISITHARFSELSRRLAGRTFDGILADLGVSSDQFEGARGFSFGDSTPLDMRMDAGSGRSAGEIVNDTEERDLYALLKRGGVGAEARAVARAIVRARPIERTDELADVIRAASPAGRGKHVDPATVAFQAIRIAVNEELEEIEALLDQAPSLARRPGRLAVLTFHSLEDRAVTARMRGWSGAGDEPALWPGQQQRERLGVLLTKKPMLPAEDELRRNPRARSARLRIFEFI